MLLLLFQISDFFVEVYIVSFTRRLHIAAVAATYFVFSQNIPPVALSWNSCFFNIASQCFAYICQNQ